MFGPQGKARLSWAGLGWDKPARHGKVVGESSGKLSSKLLLLLQLHCPPSTAPEVAAA